jgi:hypothetical protein
MVLLILTCFCVQHVLLLILLNGVDSSGIGHTHTFIQNGNFITLHLLLTNRHTNKFLHLLTTGKMCTMQEAASLINYFQTFFQDLILQITLPCNLNSTSTQSAPSLSHHVR